MENFILSEWVSANPEFAITGLIVICLVAFLFTRQVVAKGIIHLTKRSTNKKDDILVSHLKPYRLAWFAPLIILNASSVLFPEIQVVLSKSSLFLILWLGLLTINSILDAVNDLYEKSKNYNGVSIQSYLDLAKIFFIFVSIILSVTLFTGQSPWVLLTGLGALTAVLLLIFQNTILSLVASIQIVANDLLKEGDWIEVPSYGADGDVVNVNLHTIKIRNFDMTYTVIPTYKIVDVAYKNWRGMQESGGRRIQRSFSIDMVSIKFCESDQLEEFRKIDLICDKIETKINNLKAYQQEHSDHFDSPLDGPQITNIEIFRMYISAYLRNREDIFHENMPFLVRSLSPTPTGLPIEIYAFTKTTEWTQYEYIQADIFDHLVSAAQNFGLRIFQEPTGLDFSMFGRQLIRKEE
ncbi:MAG: mechanosensitive ion channel family protein [Anaerolineaceae bacterium]